MFDSILNIWTSKKGISVNEQNHALLIGFAWLYWAWHSHYKGSLLCMSVSVLILLLLTITLAYVRDFIKELGTNVYIMRQYASYKNHYVNYYVHKDDTVCCVYYPFVELKDHGHMGQMWEFCLNPLDFREHPAIIILMQLVNPMLLQYRWYIFLVCNFIDLALINLQYFSTGLFLSV